MAVTRRILCILFVSLLTLSGVGCRQGVRLGTPVDLRPGSTLAGTESAILSAIAEKRWKIERVSPGRIVAMHEAGDQVLRVIIGYDESRVRVAYLSSLNLRSEKHGGYWYVTEKTNGWFVKLAEEIAQNLPLVQGVQASAP